jgi:hypothetical protein
MGGRALLSLWAFAPGSGAAAAPCAADGAKLCLLSRYAIRAEWWQGNSQPRPATAVSVPGGQLGGLVFHSERSWDAVVTVEDRCASGGAVAIAIVATTYAQAVVHVRDGETGLEKTYRKRRGARPGTIVDAAAFACPAAAP